MMPDNTKKVYATYGKQYKEFGRTRGLPLDNQVTVASFMFTSAKRGLGRTTCVSAIPSAVAHMFRFDEVKPTAGPLVKAMKGAVAKFTDPSQPKAAISMEQVEQIMRQVRMTSFVSVRNFTMILLMTVCLLRGSEATGLLEEDVEITKVDGSPVLMVRVQKGKTDQLRFGHTILVSSNPVENLCPIRWVLFLMGHRVKGAPYFFHQDPLSWVQPALHPGLAVGTANKEVKAAIESIGEDPENYGSHSCRRGGATAAVAAGVDIVLVKRHGRWKSDVVYSYVEVSVARKLSVSLGIMKLK